MYERKIETGGSKRDARSKAMQIHAKLMAIQEAQKISELKFRFDSEIADVLLQTNQVQTAHYYKQKHETKKF